MRIAEVTIVTDTAGEPNATDLATLTSKVNAIESANTGVVVHTLDKNRVKIHPRPTKPTYVS